MSSIVVRRATTIFIVTVVSNRIHNPRRYVSQLKPMKTSVCRARIRAHTDNYLRHDCQLNIVPTPGGPRLTLSIYLSVAEPFSACSRIHIQSGMATTGDSRNVRRRTNCVHSPSAQLLAPFTPLPVYLSISLSLSLPSPLCISLSPSLPVSLRTAHLTDDSVLALTSRCRLTNHRHCRCNCTQLSLPSYSV